MKEVPLLNHPLDEATVFTPEALIAAVRADRGLSIEPPPPVCGPLAAVAQVSNAIEHSGTPFDKGVHLESVRILSAMCKAARRFLDCGRSQG